MAEIEASYSSELIHINTMIHHPCKRTATREGVIVLQGHGWNLSTHPWNPKEALLVTYVKMFEYLLTMYKFDKPSMLAHQAVESIVGDIPTDQPLSACRSHYSNEYAVISTFILIDNESSMGTYELMVATPKVWDDVEDSILERWVGDPVVSRDFAKTKLN